MTVKAAKNAVHKRVRAALRRYSSSAPLHLMFGALIGKGLFCRNQADSEPEKGMYPDSKTKVMTSAFCTTH